MESNSRALLGSWNSAVSDNQIVAGSLFHDASSATANAQSPKSKQVR